MWAPSLQPGDSALVLASDGLWDVMSDSEVVGVLARVRAFLKRPSLHIPSPGSQCCSA